MVLLGHCGIPRIIIAWHIVVHPYTGKPNIDFLNKPDKWNTSYSVHSILLDLQLLLSYPTLENPVNLEAAQLLTKDEPMYKIVIRELLLPSSPRREDGLVVAEKPQEKIRVIKTISFNDYYKTWSEIATTKIAEHSKNPFVGDPHFMGQYYKWKQQNRKNQVQWNSMFVLSKYQADRKKVMAQNSREPYDKEITVHPSPTELSFDHELKREQGFYKVPQEWSEENLPEQQDSEESWEEEADNLVTWTNGLDEESLNYEYYENTDNYENLGN
ncbi:ubiquitin-conjugating enzyme E2 U isoform X2 [Mastomys coucha]|uniref:ubiquitin-conjugating enzyme E2 U isoform X2 n=1 Tax=Mastomys coucha TaxID=35658 RepID=UPI00126165D5|nr:ubiquitin-conjugating enzyme E2 U isoform X2 [Mastomys coucha]